MSNINDFVIEDGILLEYTGAGGDVVIPDGVTSVDDLAFSECDSLTSITIPYGVMNIGNRAFGDCVSLTSVTIPDSVTSIGEDAFFCCVSLTSITIPDSVTSIGVRAFNECDDLTNLTVDKGNPVYHSSGNCIVETKTKKLICGCKNSAIPDDGSVEILGDFCFGSCGKLKSIHIPDSVTSLGEQAFAYCYWLRSIKIPDSVTSLGEYCFCDSGIKHILIPPSVTEIGEDCFCGLECDLTIYAEEGSVAAQYVEDAGEEVFVLDDIENYQEKIIEDFPCDGRALMRYTGDDAHVFIPQRINFLGGGCFEGLTHIKSVFVPELTHCIGERVFMNCTALEYVAWPDLIMVSELMYQCFAGCTSLKVMVIPSGVEKIGNQCFLNCTALECVVIPDSVEQIADDAFDGCNKLTIYANEDSYAAEYAMERGIKVKLI